MADKNGYELNGDVGDYHGYPDKRHRVDRDANRVLFGVFRDTETGSRYAGKPRRRNGYDDNVCHLTMKDNYEILPSTTIAELLGMGNLIYGAEALPYYHIQAYVDLKKFKLNPIKPNEKNPDIVPYKNYIIRRGKANFTVANSCNVLIQ